MALGPTMPKGITLYSFVTLPLHIGTLEDKIGLLSMNVIFALGKLTNINLTQANILISS